MGRGIAYTAAVGGFDVTVVDVNPAALESAQSEIERIFEKGIRYGKVSRENAEEAMSRLFFSASLEEAALKAELIIEAVPEKVEIKKAVFETIEKHAQDECYFATNTSTMSPTEIASYANRPEKTIAMHFFNPVHKMPLVEIFQQQLSPLVIVLLLKLVHSASS